MTPISHASQGKGTVGHETAFGFGRFKTNPDGSKNLNHTRFGTTGELDRYVEGANDLGPPKVDDNGVPMRRPDGTMIREGAKLYKMARSASPPPPPPKRRFVPPPDSGWVDEGTATKASSGHSGMSRESLKSADIPTYKHVSPKRRAK